MTPKPNMGVEGPIGSDRTHAQTPQGQPLGRELKAIQLHSVVDRAMR